MDAEDKDNIPAIMWAVYSGNLEVVELLMDENVDCQPDSPPLYFDDLDKYSSDDGWYGSAMTIAAGEGHQEVLQYLIDECGGELDELDYNAEEDVYGMTPLMAAARGGHEDLVEYLLEENVDYAQRNSEGRTALMMAYYLMMKGTAPLHAVSQVRNIRDIAFSSEGWDQFAFDVLYQLQD